MVAATTRIIRDWRAAGAVAMALALVSGPAFAQDAKAGDDPFSVMLKWKPAAQEKEMPAFVRDSRPPEDRLNFTPLTGEDADRPKRKTPAELEAEMKKFDAAAAAEIRRDPVVGV